MIGDACLLCRFGAVLTDILLCLDTIFLEELAHGIEVIYGYNIVFRIVEEHHVEVATGLPATGKRILAECFLEPTRQVAIGIEDGLCAEVARLLGLDKFFIESFALVLLAEEQFIFI